MEQAMRNISIAILVADGFEQIELVEPKKALEQAGGKTTIVSPSRGRVKAWQHKDWGDEFQVDKELNQAQANDYDALLLPGGVMNPDTLRMNATAVEFVKHFIRGHKPIAAICHGPWNSINAEGVRGKSITSWPSLKIDLINAGAHWVDQQVVIDDYLVTSRKPDDIPAFNKAIIQTFSHIHKTAAT